MQRYNNLELETNLSATDFLEVYISAWSVVFYNDISEINCCVLIETEENEGLWLRILEKRSFPVMVIFGHFHFQFSSSHATIHGHNEFSAKACPCFDVKKELAPYFDKESEK